MINNPIGQLGEYGEQETRIRLERALHGTGLQLSGYSDRGMDLLVQYPSPALGNHPLVFGVQVKTGNSYCESQKTRWKIKNVDKKRFDQWKKSHLPVLFVWVEPTSPVECYCQFIRKTTDQKHFSISKKAIISPASRYDYALNFFKNSNEEQTSTFQLLRPPLAVGIRPYAKEFYKNILMSSSYEHPLLGPVEVTWKGWKHLTSKKRPLPYIHQSLQLLSVVPWVISNPREFVGMRRLRYFKRGKWVTESKLLAFKSNDIKIASRADADLIIVLRENIKYPHDWLRNIELHKNVYRTVTFESIYEKLK